MKTRAYHLFFFLIGIGCIVMSVIGIGSQGLSWLYAGVLLIGLANVTKHGLALIVGGTNE